MSNQTTETKQEKDEFSRIFNDYRNRIDEITRQMQKNLGFEVIEPAPPAAKLEEIVNDVQVKAETEPGEMFPSAQDGPEIKAEANPAPANLELVPIKESEEIIREARRQASRIIAEAEKRIKDEAKKKTEMQVNKIITQAQKEAQDIIDKAKRSVDEQKTQAINILRQQAQQLIEEIVEKCRQDTQEHSSRIIKESMDKATKMINDILAAAKETSMLIEGAIASTGQTVNDFETRIKSENEALLKAISQSQNKFIMITTPVIEQKVTPAVNDRKTEPQLQNKHKDSKSSPVLAIHLLNNNHTADSNGLYIGKLEVKSVSAAFNYMYLKNLKKYLMRFPAVKYLQESASEKAVTMLFDVTEPLPLLDIIRDNPSMEEVTSENGDNITLVLKNTD